MHSEKKKFEKKVSYQPTLFFFSGCNLNHTFFLFGLMRENIIESLFYEFVKLWVKKSLKRSKYFVWYKKVKWTEVQEQANLDQTAQCTIITVISSCHSVHSYV